MWTNIKTIFLSLTCVLFISLGALACETSADCGSGEYCKQGMGSSKICSACTSRANATNTGPGSGFNQDNCPWDCINGYKKNSDNTACEPCAAGYFYYATSQRCVKCPASSTSDGTNNGYDCYWRRGTSAEPTKITDPQNNYQDLYNITSATKIYLSKMLHKAAADAVQTQSTQE